MSTWILWNIFEYALGLIEVVFFLMFVRLFESKRRKHIARYMETIGAMIVAGIIYTFTEVYIYSPIKTIVCLVCILLLAQLVYDISIKLNITLIISFGILLLGIDVLLINIIMALTQKNILTVIMEENWYRITISILAKLILFMIIKISSRYKSTSQDYVPTKFWYIVMGVFIISIISLLSLAEIGLRFKVVNEMEGILITLVAIGLFACTMIVCITFQQLCVHYQKENTYKLIEYQNNILEQVTREKETSYREVRKTWHDLNNHIGCVSMLLENSNYEAALEYMEQIRGEIETIPMEIKTGNEIVDAVLNQKRMIAQEKGIQFTANCCSLEHIQMKPIHICALLSNALDNAIDACKEIEESPIIKVNIRPYKVYLLIDIINSAYQDPTTYLKTLTTTKSNKEKHGLGFLNIKEIVQKYNGFIQYKYQKDLFYLSILVNV